MNTLQTIPDEALLLRRISQRDRAAFAELYDRYAGVLYSTVLRVLKQPAEVADVLQEVFMQIWDKAPTYDPALGKPFSWALTLARHKAIDRLRALRRRYDFIEEVTQEMAGPIPGASEPREEVFTPAQVQVIRAAVASLPLEQRQAIEMAFFGGLTQHEVAAALHQPVGTIKARIRRGMLKLRDSLRELL